MGEEVNMNRQGRVVIPLHEQERLGVAQDASLEPSAAPEGVLNERGWPAKVRTAEDGLPVVTIKEAGPISNQESLSAIRRERER